MAFNMPKQTRRSDSQNTALATLGELLLVSITFSDKMRCADHSDLRRDQPFIAWDYGFAQSGIS
ncbi:hypothetical protein [uncultured Ruegeria sp.]|uniref:hypothetical protein n=1 Tax=uncultured Ruegeria sp. TaxID=259304 RepID=UPI00260263F2|nr:hypothetical protein [uncultured Ruegeria sp.]